MKISSGNCVKNHGEKAPYGMVVKKNRKAKIWDMLACKMVNGMYIYLQMIFNKK